MKKRPSTLSATDSKADTMPFVRILPLTVAGIVAYDILDTERYLALAGMVLAMAGAWALKDRVWSGVCMAAAVVFCVMSVCSLRSGGGELPQGRKVASRIVTVAPQGHSGRWEKYSAEVECYDDGTAWKKAGIKVLAMCDTSLHLSAGDRIVAELYFNPFDGDGKYGRAMMRRGFRATTYVNDYSHMELLGGRAKGVRISAARLQAAAIERFDRLNIDGDNGDVCRAMAFGARSGIAADLREDYSRSGAAHLLATSGLHVGIVVMLLNALLCCLPLFRSGYSVRCIIVVAGVWLYAFAAGLSPSVIRAAVMLTGFEAAIAFSRPYDGFNILCFTATAMLIANPDYLYDISFQMSFAAVFGIFTLYPPIMRLLKSRIGVLNAFWGVTAVGIASSVAVAPITAYAFGQLSIVGVLLNPVVILTANIIVLFSIIQAIAPIAALAPVVKAILDWSAEVQNRVVGYAAHGSWSSVSVGEMPLWSIVGFYMVAATLMWRYAIRHEKERKMELYDR